jgi:hypothetical protein
MSKREVPGFPVTAPSSRESLADAFNERRQRSAACFAARNDSPWS